ncbi:MAG TPA: LysR substrate-binding domain-containing protein [Nocardioides sp.]|jgi:DNA-binding transcriptional LysR family regulator|uniref:LysR substrate-binding domain-containing protein n=1 Tax=Nocardioides sp. TaxID=35761 RepID=UPI002E2EBE91|nr:LysR substrate-binding domain-containing protein [Nocardioides sp.]HEX3931607.1 LysR substrate-binding domain-containing protein [Nocardioides sp.]
MSALRVGFVTGTTPDRWARAWRDQRRGPLDLVALTEAEQEPAVREGEVDMALARTPPLALGDPDLHGVRLYDELPVVVAGRDHLVSAVSAADAVTLADLSQEQLVRPHVSGWRPEVEQLAWPSMSEGEAVETVAAGTGIVIVPMSVARLHHRKDVVWREVSDLPPTTVTLVWLRTRDDARTQAFVGVVKGRTGASSRD